MIGRGVPHTTAGLRAAGRPHPPWGAHFHLRLQLKICKTSTLLLLIECQKIKSLLCIPSVGWHGHHFPHHSTSSTASCSQKMNPKQQDAGMLHSPAPVQYPTHLVETGAPHHTFSASSLLGERRQSSALVLVPAPAARLVEPGTGRHPATPGLAGAGHWGMGLSACVLPGQKAVVAKREGGMHLPRQEGQWPQDSGDGNGAARWERGKKEKKRMQKPRKWSGSAAAEGLRARAGRKGKERGRAEAQRGSKPHPTSGGLYLTR